MDMEKVEIMRPGTIKRPAQKDLFQVIWGMLADEFNGRDIEEGLQFCIRLLLEITFYSNPGDELKGTRKKIYDYICMNLESAYLFREAEAYEENKKRVQ